MPPTLLITGASSGIGRATAMHLAQRGWRVFGTSRNPARADVPGVEMLALDVSDPASIRACIDEVLRRAGRIDVLINNAGVIGPAAASEELSEAQIRAVFDTNYFGVIAVTNAVLPAMRQQRSGRILMIGSVAGVASLPPFFATYSASKHALEAYSDSLALELRDFGIHVSLLRFGYIRTPIDQSIEAPAHPLPDYAAARERVVAVDRYSIQHGSDPAIVVNAIEAILDDPAPQMRYTIGPDAHIIVWMKRLLPDPLYQRVGHQLFLQGDWDAQRLGPRRLLLDTSYAQQMLERLRPALALLLTLLTLRRLLRRKGR